MTVKNSDEPNCRGTDEPACWHSGRRQVASAKGQFAWLRHRSLLIALPLGFAAIAALLAGPVSAERSQKGNLIVFLNGGVSPRALPRGRSAPVAVRLQAGILTTHDLPLPRVKKVRLELAYRGELDTRGLAACPRGGLRAVDRAHALALCRASLVGRGSLFGRVFLPNQRPFSLHAELLAFNGETKQGQPAIWVSAYSADPPVSFVLPFIVRHHPGRFHTVLISVVPQSVGPWPHFARFHIVVSRRYFYRGRRHSYLTASCPLPPHFVAGFLSLARVTFSVSKGPKLTAETVRSCRAR
jgi:hypothetical protein